MNRLHNCTNPNQGDRQKVLCLCSAGLLRSPTLANVLAAKGYNTRAAGVNEDYALVVVDQVLVQWADVVLCVEPGIKRQLVSRFTWAEKKTYCLDIPDMYPYMHPELQEEINAQIWELQIEEVLT